MPKTSCRKFRSKIEFIHLSMEDFGERVLGKKEKEIQVKEAEGKPPETAKPNIVNEEALQLKINEIKIKIEKSPIATKYQEGMRSELEKLLKNAEKDINATDTDTAQKLTELANNLNKDLADFDKLPAVKEVHDVIEPFFSKQDVVIDTINLETYKTRSGYWQEINKVICEKLSIDKLKIEALQKHLQVKIDGKIGPETMNAIGKMLGVKIDVKFAEKTVKAKEVPEPKTQEVSPISAKTHKKPEPKAVESGPQQSPEKGRTTPSPDEKEAEKRTQRIAELEKKKSIIENKTLPAHFAALEAYVKENSGLFSSFTSFDEDLALKETVGQIKKAEAEIAGIDSEISSLTKQVNEICGKIYTQQFNTIKAGGKNTDQFLLSVDQQMGDNAPSELKPAIEAIKRNLAQNPNLPAFNKLIYQGKYSEALVQLGKDNQSTQEIGRNLTITDLNGFYERAVANPKYQYTGFKEGSYGDQKLDEGYIAISSAKSHKANAATYYLVKKEPDGSLTYSIAHNNGERFNREGRSISAKEQDDSAEKTKDLKNNMMLAISKNPNIQKIQAAGSELQSKFVPMQKILVMGMEGGKTADVVGLTREYARGLSKFDFYALRRNLEAAKADLKLLKSFPAGVTDESEAQIKQMEQSLKGITDLVEGQKIENFCRHILDEDEFNEDNFKNWFMKEGIVMLTAIVVATAAVCLLVGSGGTGAPAALLMLAKAAAIGTAAGMVGAEFAHAGIEVAAVAQGKENKNRSLLGKYAMEQSDLDVRTGEHTHVTGKDVTKNYLKQFAVGTATTFLTMGLGKGAGNLLSRFANNNAVREGIVGALARTANKIPKLKPQQVNVLEKKGVMAVLTKIGNETFDELGDEIGQGLAGEIDRQINKKFNTALSPFSALVNFYTSLSGGSIEHSAGNLKLAAEGVQTIPGQGATTIISDYSYDITKTTEMLAELQKTYGSKPGFNIETVSDGTITVTNEITTKKGTYTNVVNLKPTAQNIEIKRILSTTDGPSELASLYGVESSGDNACTYDSLKPKGKIDLAKYLKRKGFKIEGDPMQGEFTATKGDELVTFKQKQATPGPKLPDNGPTGDGPVGGGDAPEGGEEEQVLPKKKVSEAKAKPEAKNESEKAEPADDPSANPEVAKSAKAAEWKKNLEKHLKGLKAELQDTVRGMVDLLAKGADIGKGKFNDALKNWAKIRTEVGEISQKLFKGLDAQFIEMAQIFKVEWTSIIEDAKEASSKAKEAKKAKKESKQETREQAEREQNARRTAKEQAARERAIREQAEKAERERARREKAASDKQESRNKQSRDLRQNSERKEYSEVIRETDVFYVPDIHGDVKALHSSLLTMGLVNNNGDWIGQNKVLQFSGDYIDRGKSNLATLDYLSKVQQQAQAAGGRVDLLMGNHEALMMGTLMGDVRSQLTWLTNGGREVLEEVMTKHNLQSNQEDEAIAILRKECLEPGGKYYELIQGFKPASQVDDVLYVHAGVSPKWSGLLRQHGVDGINARWKQALEQGKKGDLTLFNEFNEIGRSRGGHAENGGLFWIDFQHELATMSDAQVTEIAQNLKAIGINAIVVGHSQVKNPTLLANFQKQGIKLIASDVSMSHAYGERAGRGSDVSGVGGVKIDTNGSITAKSSAGEHELHTEIPKAKAEPGKKADEPKAKKTKKDSKQEAKEQAEREQASRKAA